MRLIIILIFLISVKSIRTQNIISGKVTDINKNPIEFVNVLIFQVDDTHKPYKGVITDSAGIFNFTDIPYGHYQVKVQFLGYRNQVILIEKIKEENLDLGIIQLVSDIQMLDGIEVTARKTLIEKTNKGFIVNTNVILSQEGGTAVDILRNTPTLFVDAEGGVTLRGKKPLILINGRNSRMNNLPNIAASSIEKIEIITNPSAEYDAEAENGIINIILKKGKKEGLNGAFAIGTGYGAKARFNSSALLNYKSKSFNIGLGYDNRIADRIRKAEGDRVNFNLPNQYFLTQRRSDDRKEAIHNLRMNLDYENDKYALNTEALYSFENETNLETLFSTFEKQSREFFNKNERFSEEIRNDNIYEGALTLKRKYTETNRKLLFNATTSFNRGNENTNIITQYLTASNEKINQPFLQKTSFTEKSNITNLRVDYTQGLGKGIIELGYKSLLRFFDNEFAQQDQVNGILQAVPSRTGNLIFSEGIHAFYGQYKFNIEKWNFEGGVRAEQTINSGAIENQNTKFNNSYLNIFPSINLGHQLSESNNLSILYGRRINRPSLGQLNPYVDITDSLTQRSGNPNLKPEIVDNFEISYSLKSSQYNLITKTYYRFGQNTILAFTELNNNGALFTKLFNIGNTRTYGLEGIFSYTPFTVWQGNLSASIFNQKIDANNIKAEVVNQVLSWNIKWLNEFNLSKNSRLQFIGIYNAPTATVQGTRIAVYNVDLAFQQKILKSNGRLGIIITDIFDTQRSGFTWNTVDFNFNRRFKVDTRAILITFAYTFNNVFKESLMKNQFTND